MRQCSGRHSASGDSSDALSLQAIWRNSFFSQRDRPGSPSTTPCRRGDWAGPDAGGIGLVGGASLEARAGETGGDEPRDRLADAPSEPGKGGSASASFEVTNLGGEPVQIIATESGYGCATPIGESPLSANPIVVPVTVQGGDEP